MLKSLFELRRQQHCKCGLPIYPRTSIDHFCKCTDCYCTYCKTKIPHDEDPEYLEIEQKIIMKKLTKKGE